MPEALTPELYLATFFPVVGLLIALLLLQISYLRNIEKGTNRIETNTKVLGQLYDWFAKRGMDISLSPYGVHHSLPPEQARRRDELLHLGRVEGLDEAQAQELRELLNEDARDDLARGILGALAFVAIIAAIGAIVNAITRRRTVP